MIQKVLLATILCIAAAQAQEVAAGNNEESQVKCFFNLRKLGLALREYHDTFERFPATASYDEQGNPLLSWRVHLLPFVGQEELYREFHLNESWDSDHNSKLVSNMPKVFFCPAKKLGMQGKTTYLAPRGRNLAFEGKVGTRLATFTDGTANTILLVEAGEKNAVIWTKPGDLEVDLAKPANGLALVHKKGCLVSLGDCSVRYIRDTIDRDVLRWLLQRNDGHKIPRY